MAVAVFDAGEIEHHHALAAEPAGVGLDDADGERRGDRGVDRVAAGLQHLEAGLRRQRVRRGHHALLRGDLRVPGLRGQAGCDAGGEQGGREHATAAIRDDSAHGVLRYAPSPRATTDA